MAYEDQLDLQPLPVRGAYLVTGRRHRDERGWFARNWCSNEMKAHGIDAEVAETSLSHSSRAGTLRGLHFQVAPHEEAKLVTCVRGRIWDAIVDIRVDSPTFKQWHGEALDGDTLRTIYVPKGVAHGFITLSDEVLVLYQISERHSSAASRGVRWDDPAFSVEWPLVPAFMSERDRAFPDFSLDSSENQ